MGGLIFRMRLRRVMKLWQRARRIENLIITGQAGNADFARAMVVRLSERAHRIELRTFASKGKVK